MPRYKDETDTLLDGRDYLGSREVIDRIEYLEGEREACEDEDNPEATAAAIKEWDASADAEELSKLRAFAEDMAGYCDWMHDAQMIRDEKFEEHAQAEAKDLGMLKGTESWPLNCIDWSRAARELQYDYTSAELDGVTYWVRG